MKIGNKVEIKEFDGGSWRWAEDGPPKLGHIVDVDKHCYSVRTDDGNNIRDVHDHFRETPTQ